MDCCSDGGEDLSGQQFYDIRIDRISGQRYNETRDQTVLAR